jgi:hypothetical protein
VRGGDRRVEIVLRYEPGRARFEADVVDATSGLAVDPAEVRVRKSTGAFRGAPTFKARTAVGRVTVDRLRPGDYVIDVRLTDGSRASQTFTVKPEDALVRIRMAIGKPAVVTVRVDLAAIPAAERPQSIAVFTVPGDAVRWVTSPGQPAPNATRGYGSADAANDWTVRFDDVTPNVPIRFWTYGPLHASARITVGFGEDKALVLRPAPGVPVTFTGRAGASGCRLVLFVKDADGTWSPVDWATWEPGKEWRGSERWFAPGRLEWRAERFDPESDRDDADAVVEGVLDLAAGKAREVPIVFPK